MFWIFWRHFALGGKETETMVESPRNHKTVMEAAHPARISSHVRSALKPSNDIASLISRFGREVFCVLDSSLHCHYLTENWQVLSGFTAAEDIGGEFKTRIAPDHLRRVEKYLSQGHGSGSVCFQLKNKDGQWLWCELQLVEKEAGNSGKEQYKCLMRDVTGLVTSQGKLEKAKLEAELAIKSRSEFLANMSHELRTPLNAILGFAQMMENGTYGDIGHVKYHDYVGNIQESGTTLLSKINDLLEIANIDSGRMEIRESSTDLLCIIRHAIEFHSHRAFAAQVTLRPHLPSEPLMVVVDRIRMLQVVTNLLSNAIKYTPAGGTVDICCEMRRDGGINILIEDSGDGILPVHLANILTAFRQDNSFFARSRDCVGLGLALSKEIVKLHQGRIDIDSEPGKGTLIAIRLPRERTVKRPAAKKVESNIALAVN